MDPEVVGLILARGGSQGIPLKNIRELHGQPLILRTLRCLIDFGRFSAIWVSTDHPQIEACIRASALPSVEIFRRSGEHAHHAASSVSAVWEFLQAHPEIHRVALIQCTSPFLDVNHLERAWALICRGCESVFSVTRQKKLRWSEVQLGAGQFTTPLNFDPAHRPRRQDWAGELIENGMFYWTNRDLVQKGLLQGAQSAYVEIEPEDSLEIDTEMDWMLAELRLSRDKKLKD